VTGLVNLQLLLQNEYLAAQTRILKARLQPGWRLSDGERATLAEIGKRLGRKGLQPVARLAKPDTILAWYRRLVAEKFDGSKQRRTPGRPRTRPEIEDLVVRLARENSAGATTGLWEHWPIWGIRCPTRPWATSCAGMASPLCRSGAKPPPGGTSFAGTGMFSIGTDFFTVDVLTWRGLVAYYYYVLFSIHLDSRRVSLAGITDHPEACWMRQVACNATFDAMGHLNGCRYVLHDRDAKFCGEFRETLAVAGVKCLRLPPRSPNLNAFAERWVRSVKEECLSHLLLFGERSLRKALTQFQEHYHEERNHQGKNNVLLFPTAARLEPGRRRGIRCRERLGGLLRYYSRAA